MNKSIKEFAKRYEKKFGKSIINLKPLGVSSRNWEIFVSFVSGNTSQKDLSKEHKISGARIHQICRKTLVRCYGERKAASSGNRGN